MRSNLQGSSAQILSFLLTALYWNKMETCLR